MNGREKKIIQIKWLWEIHEISQFQYANIVCGRRWGWVMLGHVKDLLGFVGSFFGLFGANLGWYFAYVSA